MNRRDLATSRPVPATRWFEDSFGAIPGQVSAARHAVGRLLADCPVRDEALLIVSELASNSVLHSQSRGGGEFTVRAEIHGDDYIWLEVEDAGGPWRVQAPDGERGHGLQLVAALSGAWGVEDIGQAGAGGRVVWARLEL